MIDTTRKVNDLINKIQELDYVQMEVAKRRLQTIAKPINSLGKLESAVIQLAGIEKDASTLSLQKKALVIFCADHGVVEEGVTQTSSEVTKIVANNFTKGKSCVNIMANTIGVDVYPIDIGMDTKADYVEGELLNNIENETMIPLKLLNKKVNHGTKNIALEPAMTKRECESAILVGIEMVRLLKEDGYKIIATGEMGIGNTTPSSAIAAFLLEKSVELVTGKGAGLSYEGIKRKITVIKRAIERAKNEGATIENPMEVLRQLGGFEIAGMVGTFLGGAIYRVPVVIDGFISSIAALLAERIKPGTTSYMLPSHVSKEPAGKLVLDALSLEPMVTLDMCLGEGSGAMTIIPLLQMGLEVYNHMATFEEIHVTQYEDFEKKEMDL